MTKRDRIADFAERAALDPNALRVTTDCGRYVLVNPTSDQTKLLAKLGVKPSECDKVDLYWEYDGDVRFVQIQTEDYTTIRKPGLYARRGPSGYLNLVMVVQEAVISSEVVLAALTHASKTRIDRLQLTTKLERI